MSFLLVVNVILLYSKYSNFNSNLHGILFLFYKNDTFHTDDGLVINLPSFPEIGYYIHFIHNGFTRTNIYGSVLIWAKTTFTDWNPFTRNITIPSNAFYSLSAKISSALLFRNTSDCVYHMELSITTHSQTLSTWKTRRKDVCVYAGLTLTKRQLDVVHWMDTYNKPSWENCQIQWNNSSSTNSCFF